MRHDLLLVAVQQRLASRADALRYDQLVHEITLFFSADLAEGGNDQGHHVILVVPHKEFVKLADVVVEGRALRLELADSRSLAVERRRLQVLELLLELLHLGLR